MIHIFILIIFHHISKERMNKNDNNNNKNTNKEYYKINLNNDILWKIKSTLVMKQIFPIYFYNFSKKNNKELL